MSRDIAELPALAADSHVETIHKGSKSYEKICGKMSPVGFWVIEPDKSKYTRTEVSPNFNRVLEVDHRRRAPVGQCKRLRAALASGKEPRSAF